MQRLTVTFSQQEAEGLLALSRQERRRPHDQAAFLIAEGLRGRGLLPDPQPDTPPDDPSAPPAREEAISVRA